MIIKKISLLNKPDFSKYKYDIPLIHNRWWLTSSVLGTSACVVNGYNVFPVKKTMNDIGVRPILIVTDFDTFIGDKINLFDYSWTVIDHTPKKSILLCDTIIDEYFFDRYANDWCDSDLKSYLEIWLADLKKAEEVVIINGKTEYLLLQALCKKYDLNEVILKGNNNFEKTLYLVYSPVKPWRQITKNKALSYISNLTFKGFCNKITEEKGEI